MAIREHSQKDCAEWANEEGDTESCKRHQKRRNVAVRWKKQFAYRGGKKSVNDEIEPLQRIADRCSSDRFPASRQVDWCRCRRTRHGVPTEARITIGNSDRFPAQRQNVPLLIPRIDVA